jgi:N-formylmaleamate deformylase
MRKGEMMAEWKSSEVATNGITMFYWRSGGDKPPLVLAHGLTDNGRCWLPVADVLAADYDVFLFDARGHGRSSAPEQGYSNADHAADYAGAIAALGLSRPAMLGHSMGAATAAQLAASYPESVSCVLLEDPPWRADLQEIPAEQRQANAAQWRNDALARKAFGYRELLEQIRRDQPTWAPGEYEPWVEAKLELSPRVLDYVSAPSTPWLTLVRQIQCPALLLIGDVERRAIVSAESAAEIAGLNNKFQVAHIPGAGHSIRREQFEPYVQAVRAFLQQHYSA